MAVGIVWLAAALPAALLLDFRELGWWLGHALRDRRDRSRGLHRRRRPSTWRRTFAPAARRPEGADLVAEEEAFLGSHIRALLVALAEKDTYTEAHTRRVALRAVQIGDELGLAPERLRDLALGGLLHDVGKLSVPDEILKKPGPLTEDEFAAVRRHVVSGVALLHELGGFSATVHQLVGSHHERLDGTGYPDGAGPDELSLDVRILAVCDVYDALISTRVYRGAWSHERALALLREGSGSTFDARCVDALERVLARERSADLAVAV